jgi:biopolymer transport protein ExbD
VNRSRRRHFGHAPKKKLEDVRNDINVTPLVDVCLVLLIIFMVVTPMLTRGKEVSLPKTRHHTEKKDNGKQPIVSVTREGRLYFDQDGFATQDLLRDRIAREARLAPGLAFSLKADESLSWGQVYPALMAIVQGAGNDTPIDLATGEFKEK